MGLEVSRSNVVCCGWDASGLQRLWVLGLLLVVIAQVPTSKDLNLPPNPRNSGSRKADPKFQTLSRHSKLLDPQAVLMIRVGFGQCTKVQNGMYIICIHIYIYVCIYIYIYISLSLSLSLSLYLYVSMHYIYIYIYTHHNI